MTHVVMRIRNTVLALLAVAAAGPGAAQTPAPDSVSAGLYAAAGAGMLSPAARRAVPFVYVPNSKDGTVTVIDPLTYRVLRSFATGALPQRSEEHTSELQSQSNLVCRLLLEKKNIK